MKGTRKDVRAELDDISGRYSTLFVRFPVNYLTGSKGEQRKKTDQRYNVRDKVGGDWNGRRMVETEIYRGRLPVRCDAGLAALDLGTSPARDGRVQRLGCSYCIGEVLRRSDRTRHSGHMICSGFKETTITAATRAILFHFFPKSLAFFHLSLINTQRKWIWGET